MNFIWHYFIYLWKTNALNKILLVDDDPDILEIISYSLENEGYSVYKAMNGLQAIEIAEKVKEENGYCF